MRVRTPIELGLAIREQRRRRGWTQAELAEQVGVGRQWVVAVEQGKARAEVGLVLRAMNALGLMLSIAPEVAAAPARLGAAVPPIDIDAIVEAAKGRPR